MKNSEKFVRSFLYCTKLLFCCIVLLQPSNLQAQINASVSGKIVEANSQQALPFATIALLQNKDGKLQLLSGTISDANGLFTLHPAKKGWYSIKVSSVGYKSVIKEFEIIQNGILDAGIIAMEDSVNLMAEAVVVGERLKGKTENDKTVFYINKKILAVSGNTPGMLRHIPGIQVDLKQNITLRGNQNILLLVNGKERDKSYISQINHSQIERVEIMDTPPSNYTGNVSGVINIILKEEKITGISGQFFTEIPTSRSIIYSFPNYTFQYSSQKLSLYTSYNGEINFENIDEEYTRQIKNSGPIATIHSMEEVRQKNLSHKFHFGIDYNASAHDIIHYYGSINPYSYEQDGKAYTCNTSIKNQNWNARQEETDKNLTISNSIYYKHLFNKAGNEISMDVSNSILKSSSSIDYFDDKGDNTLSTNNKEKPQQMTTNLRIDYSTPPGNTISINAGTQAIINNMKDNTENGFGYNEQIYAGYGTLRVKKAKYNLNLGLRLEFAQTTLKNSKNNTNISALPYLTFSYKISDKQNILFSYRYSTNRPNVFQLNPYTISRNPYTLKKGNPMLKPDFRHYLYAEHAIRFDISYISYKLFYEKINNTITNFTTLNEKYIFETQLQNLGTVNQYGLQFLGSLKLGKLTISSSIQIYNQLVAGKIMEKQYDNSKKNNQVLDFSFSSILSLKYDFAISGIFQYSTLKYNIQEHSFCNALYFISIDKTCKNNFKIGVMTALPFAKTFIYQGNKIEEQDFSSNYHGNLNLPAFPLMLRLSYQFQSGKTKVWTDKNKETIPKKQKSGL